MHAAARHGTPSLTSLPKDDEVSCEVRQHPSDLVVIRLAVGGWRIPGSSEMPSYPKN